MVLPLISRPSAPPDGVLPKAVASAFDTALGQIKQPAPAFLDVEGMSGRRYRLFANALLRRIPKPRYLEIGVSAGSTLCSAISGNWVRGVVINKWSEFDGLRERFFENLWRFGTTSEVRVIERDFHAVDVAAQGRFNVYLYRGAHDAADQHDALTRSLPALDPEFVFIVDDWNRAQVREGTLSAIGSLGLQIIYAIEVRTTADETPPPHRGFEATPTDWHSGYYIAVLRQPKQPVPLASRFWTAATEASATRHASTPEGCEVLALITHLYRPERPHWLTRALHSLSDLGVRRIQALIVTDTTDPAALAAIQNAALPHLSDSFAVEVVESPPLLHPYDLPWAQKALIAERFLNGGAFTHVVSLEDDLSFGAENFRYWLRYRPLLARHRLIPSFMRTELRIGDPVIYATDALATTSLAGKRSVCVGEFAFVALDNPYCALFVLDRALGWEYAISDEFDMGASMAVSPFNTRERAATGLCWDDPPPGFVVRQVVPVDQLTMSVAQCSYVRHLPGNYGNDPASLFGKIPADKVLAP